GAVAAVDGDPPAPRDEADDLVPGQRVAALRVPDEDVVDPVEADAVAVAASDLPDERPDPALPDRGRGFRLFVAILLGRREEIGDGARGYLAVADADEELVGRRDAEFLEDLAHLVRVLAQLVEAHPVLVHLLLEELAAELQGFVALLGA